MAQGCPEACGPWLPPSITGWAGPRRFLRDLTRAALVTKARSREGEAPSRDAEGPERPREQELCGQRTEGWAVRTEPWEKRREGGEEERGRGPEAGGPRRDGSLTSHGLSGHRDPGNKHLKQLPAENQAETRSPREALADAPSWAWPGSGPREGPTGPASHPFMSQRCLSLRSQLPRSPEISRSCQLGTARPRAKETEVSALSSKFDFSKHFIL